MWRALPAQEFVEISVAPRFWGQRGRLCPWVGLPRAQVARRAKAEGGGGWGGRNSESVPRDTSEEVEHLPIDLDSSSELPDSPPLSIQLHSLPASSDQIRAPSEASKMISGRLNHVSYDQLREMCKQHGCGRKSSEAALETRLASMR